MVRGDSWAAMAWAFSMVPPFSRQAVMPVGDLSSRRRGATNLTQVIFSIGSSCGSQQLTASELAILADPILQHPLLAAIVVRRPLRDGGCMQNAVLTAAKKSLERAQFGVVSQR